MMQVTFLTSGLSCFFLAVAAQASAPPHSLLRGEHRHLLNNGNYNNEQECIGLAGYSWCASLNQCLRPFETTCPPVHDLVHPVHPVQPLQPVQPIVHPVHPVQPVQPIVLPGGDVDQYGCRASAGETFCAYTRQCARPGACTGFVCPTVYAPVTCDGYYDFSNLCEAEREGYSPQQCTSVAVIYDDCDAVYAPVQCQGNTYANLCEAERDGYDPQQCTSIIGGGGSVGPGGGCDRTYRPVICDGYYQYNNLCLAEAEGYTQYDCVDTGGGGDGGGCGAVYEPVSCDGNRYSNFCEAERAGYYVQDCSFIGAGPVDPGVGCPYTFLPVLCDGYNTYDNVCLAEAAGYTAYDCVDVGGTGGHSTGPCPPVYAPVCCEGQQYNSLCEAEQVGYGQHSSSHSCTNGECRPGHHNNPVVVVGYCGTIYEPVSCGGYDFSNFCEAERAGYYPQQCTSIMY